MPDRRRILYGPWQDVTGDRERDTLICALRAIEVREGERRGWDQPPRLMALLMPDLDSPAMHVEMVPMNAWRTSAPNPTDWLISTAQRQTVAPPDRSGPPKAFADSPGGFAGLALMFEGWAAPDEAVSPEEEARRARGERTFASNPARVELRSTVAVDINGHKYQLDRFRGQEPKLTVTDDAPLSGVGRVTQSLQRLTVARYEGVFAY